MTEAEFFAALGSGDDIVFDPGADMIARTLPAEWLARALMRGLAVRVENAALSGALELDATAVAMPLHLVACTLERFTARACTFMAPVRVAGSHVREIDVSGSYFERAFVLQGTDCATLDIGLASFAERFAVDSSSIGRLSNDGGRSAQRQPLAYYLSPAYLASVVRRRPRTVAVAVSLVVHVLIALFIWQRHVEPAKETVATVQRLVFERKPAPTPRPVRRTPPEPRHVAVVRPAPVVRTLGAARPSTSPRVVPKPPHVPAAHLQPKELAKIAPHATPVQRQVLSDSRIAQIESGLRSAIASDRARLDPLAGTTSAIAAPKHFHVDAASFSEGDPRRHRGLCDPVKDWTEGKYDYYYVICNVRFSDGTFQRQGVPWPVRFSKTDDPFNGTAAGEKPLAMPLPGWHLGPGETVTPELRDYARQNGVDLDAAD